MKGGKAPLGYTIVEVMVVLAVSAFMLVISGSFINGKTRQASFDSGVKELAASIQEVIQEVKDGQFSDVPLDCSANSPQVIVSAAAVSGVNKQGQNQECIFLGKVMHFSVAGNRTKYEVVPVAGSRQDVDNPAKPSTDPIQAGAAAIPELTTLQSVPQNLDVKHVVNGNTVTAAALTRHYAIGFIQDLGSLDSGGGQVTYNAGAQTSPKIYRYPVINANAASATTNTTVAERLGTPYMFDADVITLCVTNGDRFAEIIIGKSTNLTVRGDVSVDIRNLGRNTSTRCF
jgi:type II secretory pathway pseudopilin PulG